MSDRKHPCHNCSDDNFIKHLEKASEVVQTWPIWKQTVLGVANSSCVLNNTTSTNLEKTKKRNT